MRRSALWAVFVLGLAAPLDAQTEAEPPAHVALVNARIVVEPGRVIDRGTVVVRDGRIVAVGAGTEAPAGAVVMDMTGLTVYPGLIDAASTIGLPSVISRPGGGGGPPQGPPGARQQARQAAAERPETPPEIRADRSAAEAFAPTESDLEALRSQGVTAVGLVFDGGLLPGQAAVALLGDGEPSSQVLRSPVAQQIAFGRRRGGYPGTLMGALAYVRQAYYDAQHAGQLADAFERNHGSGPRPVHDATTLALRASLSGEIPAWIEASRRRDFSRAVEVARDIGFPSWAILGAHEAYQALDELEALNVPLIISVDFPEARTETGRTYELHVAPAEGEDTVKAQADTAAARRLRSNAARVAEAGIPFALSGHGLDSSRDFRDHVIAAVEAGLPADAALRALTVTPASLLGLSGALGTVEAGRIANLVVVEGDLFDEAGRIRHVFVEGRRFEVAERQPARRAAGETGGGAVNAAGEWVGTIEMSGTTVAITLTLAVDGENLSGTLASEMGSTELSGTLEGNGITLAGTFAPPGVNAMALTITGTIEEDELRGTLDVQGQAAVPFTARRRGPGMTASATNTQGGDR